MDTLNFGETLAGGAATLGGDFVADGLADGFFVGGVVTATDLLGEAGSAAADFAGFATSGAGATLGGGAIGGASAAIALELGESDIG
ncbi:MAG: hypothetical protein WC054_03150 [Candidatus Nanopelagicales bacterium]